MTGMTSSLFEMDALNKAPTIEETILNSAGVGPKGFLFRQQSPYLMIYGTARSQEHPKLDCPGAEVNPGGSLQTTKLKDKIMGQQL